MTTTLTPTAPLNGRSHDLYQVVQRLDEAATSPDWRAEIEAAIEQLQALLAGENDPPVWMVIATRQAGLPADPPDLDRITVVCNLRPVTYADALARRALVEAGNAQNRYPYTVRVQRAH